MREKALEIFNAAVAAVQPSRLMTSYLYKNNNVLHIFDQQILIEELQNIYVIGAGKASAAMAMATEDILEDLITEGLVVTKYEHSLPLRNIRCIEAAHPVPDASGVLATSQTIELLKRAGAKDIVICLISGGASALWIDVPTGSSLDDVQETFRLLLKCGASIDEINIIRKHLSAIKGGQLLRHAPEAGWFSFIISDVPGDALPVIASGPTVPDINTFAEAKKILEKYNLISQLPSSILTHINNGVEGIINDTPKKGDPVFGNAYNRIIGNNSMALEAAKKRSEQFGYKVAFVEGSLNGDAAAAARAIINLAKKYAGIRPACFLLGGETTVAVKGNGKGGRNQQLALSALLELALKGDSECEHTITLLSAGTDGTDGPTDAAGAIVDKDSLPGAAEKNLDASKYLEDNDAYHFFEQINGLIKTGATQTNVMDMVVMMIE